MRTELRRLLELNEGNEEFPYVDTVGKVTIGIGHNLTDKGLPEDIRNMIFWRDLDEVLEQLDHHLPWAKQMDAVRYAVLIDLVYNMGIGGVLKFKNTLRALEQHKWGLAAKGIESSLYHRQVPVRANRNCLMLRTGKWPWEK